MFITELKMSVATIVQGFKEDIEGNITAYSGRLNLTPAYQRGFVYKEKQRNTVISSILNGYPINPIYLAKTSDDNFEVLDGQQRLISIARYCNKEYPITIEGAYRFYHNLNESERNRLDNYQLTLYLVEGTADELLSYFKELNNFQSSVKHKL